MITETQIREALKAVKYPGFSRDIVSFGLLKGVTINQQDVTVHLLLDSQNPDIPRQITEDATRVLQQMQGIGHVVIDIISKGAGADRGPLPGVKNIVAVASGKGGVGKSTVSVNLAVSLARQGLKVGLLDCDLYGPSMALMFGTNEPLCVNERDEIIPVEAHGVKLLSMGLLLDDNSPVVVRGPIATKYIQQFLKQVAWGDLDFLILDLPPGTGDIQLTIVQTVPVNGAVIVTTPQEVALIDARKAIAMFEKVQVPIVGLVENMSYFLCPSDGVKYPIFGEGGGKREAERLNVPLLAEIPIDMEVRRRSDEGSPVAVEDPAQNAIAEAFFLLSRQVALAFTKS